MVLYCNFRSLAFLGFFGFLNEAAKNETCSYPAKCSQAYVGMFCSISLRLKENKSLKTEENRHDNCELFLALSLGGFRTVYLQAAKPRKGHVQLFNEA